MRFNQTALTITTLMLFASPAVAGGPLVFEWSGTDSNSNPLTISYTVRDVQNGEGGFVQNLFDSSGVYTATENTSETSVITNVTGDIFGGSYTLPAAFSGDPYQYVETTNDNGNTLIEMLAGADSSDIGLTFNGDPVNWVVVKGTANFAFVDPTTATSYSDLFPVGTYSFTPSTTIGGFGGEIVWDGGSRTFNATGLTISVAPAVNVIPEPASLGLALLGLGGITVLRRR